MTLQEHNLLLAGLLFHDIFVVPVEVQILITVTRRQAAKNSPYGYFLSRDSECHLVKSELKTYVLILSRISAKQQANLPPSRNIHLGYIYRAVGGIQH
jgi:hypothetical protein